MPTWIRIVLKLAAVLISIILSYNTGVEIERARQPVRAFEVLRDFLKPKKPNAVPVAPVPVATPTATKHWRPFKLGSLLGAHEDKPFEPLTQEEAVELGKLLLEE